MTTKISFAPTKLTIAPTARAREQATILTLDQVDELERLQRRVLLRSGLINAVLEAEAANGKTSPEELIAAAHAACFSMALSNGLAKAGHAPQALDTQADVTFQPGTGITGIKLTVVGVVPGIDAEQFEAAAQDAKANCPVSQALTGTTITLEASLQQ